MKPRILLVSDSPYLDTGFARVAREIGVTLVKSGNYVVAQHGWFHRHTNRLIPYQVFPANSKAASDGYGIQSYAEVVAKFKPDLVLTIGDEWMIRHTTGRPRKHLLYAYVPIDGAPVALPWMRTFNRLDQLVVYGDFGEQCVLANDPSFPLEKIPHGVDTDVFHPMPHVDRVKARRRIVDEDDGRKFVVGTVSRNNARKNLPALIEAFSDFVAPASACQNVECGHITRGHADRCPVCGSEARVFPMKSDAWLYMHTVPDESMHGTGHDLAELVRARGISKWTSMPQGMQVGAGVSDLVLNEIYNAMDVFTLPTQGEGFGLTILEAQAAGVPVLVTDYSAHLEFVEGAGATIPVASYFVSTANHAHRAIVDQTMYVANLDMMYYEPEDFVAKWGGMLSGSHEIPEHFTSGSAYRRTLSEAGPKAAARYTWSRATSMWLELIDQATRQIRERPGSTRTLQLETI